MSKKLARLTSPTGGSGKPRRRRRVRAHVARRAAQDFHRFLMLAALLGLAASLAIQALTLAG
jgi:hypothetical protein